MSEEKPIEKQTVNFNEIYKGGLDSVGGLTELEGKSFVISAVDFQQISSLGDVAIVTVEVGKKTEKRHTFSAVLLKQLQIIADVLKSGRKVKVTLKRIKNYYTFA
jgi:hypothetical protein